MARFIFDTNIFNRIVDGEVDPAKVKADVDLCVTHIQLNELQRTRNEERRKQLLAAFEALGPERIPTESAVWGVSEWGEAKWTGDDSLYQPLVLALNTANGGKPNNAHDVLIAENRHPE